MFVITGDIPTAAITKDIDAAYHLSETLNSQGVEVFVDYVEEDKNEFILQKSTATSN